ncbi:FAD-dependent oxidoreductase [Alpinimonas psychrophila]|uniref:3-phenylpropionate/trans-cinnamate dioxygenase ferredoxin reductase subunit n=1 Tax=Alpinimonas psychrophila TaxID=748908 RepID=A0A7W3PP68_9MICO|nr:FAD-dependent oxidoreductase [Alpinimonas psychrophila]MBA8828961.1 3-phenylpropionate/trans-cinnamate dioxygenase ferredoxin reductase subunit [Alpinimonas psychrophila]
MSHESILIVGAGQAGMQIAVTLREDGYEGELTIVGEEPHGPYQRPPLSKAYLAGDADVESLELRSPSFYVERGIVVITDEKVEEISFEGPSADDRGVAVTSTGRELHFTGLALAPGSTPRRLPLPGADFGGVLYLRDLADADELKSRWSTAQNVVVVGGGFIGLEVAAGARKAGKTVTVLEAADRLIARAVSTETSEFFRQAHERRGTSVRLAAQLSQFVGDGDQVTGVQLADGEVIPADIVLVGIGVIARGELAEKLGLEVINGAIVVDEFARTSDHRVVASGDAVLLPHPLGGGTQVRLESVQNAVDQSRIAAASLLGKSERYRAVPWFWSDQADLKLQIAGLSTGYDQTVVRGNPDDEKFSVLYFREGRLIAIDTVNDAPDYMAVRRALGDGQTIDPATAADTSVKLKSLVIDA